MWPEVWLEGSPVWLGGSRLTGETRPDDSVEKGGRGAVRGSMVG